MITNLVAVSETMWMTVTQAESLSGIKPVCD